MDNTAAQCAGQAPVGQPERRPSALARNGSPRRRDRPRAHDGARPRSGRGRYDGAGRQFDRPSRPRRGCGRGLGSGGNTKSPEGTPVLARAWCRHLAASPSSGAPSGRPDGSRGHPMAARGLSTNFADRGLDVAPLSTAHPHGVAASAPARRAVPVVSEQAPTAPDRSLLRALRRPARRPGAPTAPRGDESLRMIVSGRHKTPGGTAGSEEDIGDAKHRRCRSVQGPSGQGGR